MRRALPSRVAALLGWAGRPRVRAELLAASWETFSVLLFVSAVVPAVFQSPCPAVVFFGSMVVSAALAPRLLARGPQGFALAGVVRAVSWALSILPVLASGGSRLVVAALAFGLMAAGIRRAIYRRLAQPNREDESCPELAETLRPRLGEAAMVAGIVGGHVVLLFSVAFLRTRSQVVLGLWFEVVPALALLGTVGFTLAVRPATGALLAALAAGADGSRELLARGLAQAVRLADRLAYLNFLVWSGCIAGVVLRIRPGPVAWKEGDAGVEIALGVLFAFGVSFYQRAFHRDTLRPVLARLRSWTGSAESAEPTPLRRRMLYDFGLPLVFTSALSLLSSIGLYRTLGSNLTRRDDFDAVAALGASFTMLVLAAGGIVARAARDLSRPMTELARAADRVANGNLDAAVPPLFGPVEVVGLGQSVERMREALAATIAELSAERAGLERNVEVRTAELRRTLDELRQTQAALVQGERLASIGELVSGVAHEIYNPLNAIAGAVVPLERLASELRSAVQAYREAEAELSPERRRSLEAMRVELDLDASLDDLAGIATVVRRATDRSVKIVANLKNFSRVSGEATPTDLHACLDETLMLLGPRLRHAGIAVEKRFGPLPLVVCRAGELNQVFMNLLVNAIHALELAPAPPSVSGLPAKAPSEDSSPELVVDPRIVLETRVEGDLATVSVADNGPGVSAAVVKRIFDPFFTTKARGQGTGLGLSISSDIVRRHGGALLHDPVTPTGARFTCRLPLRPAEARPRRRRTSAPAGPQDAQGSPAGDAPGTEGPSPRSRASGT